MSLPLGEKVRIERKRLGLTLDQLAEYSGSSKSYIWELENRPNLKVSADKLLKIANTLKVTMEYLLNEEQQEESITDIDRKFFRKFSKLDATKKNQLQKILDALEDD